MENKKEGKFHYFAANTAISVSSIQARRAPAGAGGHRRAPVRYGRRAYPYGRRAQFNTVNMKSASTGFVNLL